MEEIFPLSLVGIILPFMMVIVYTGVTQVSCRSCQKYVNKVDTRGPKFKVTQYLNLVNCNSSLSKLHAIPYCELHTIPYFLNQSRSSCHSLGIQGSWKHGMKQRVSSMKGKPC